MNTFTLTLKPAIELTEDQFFHLCQNNQDARFERSASGELIVMPPTGGETSRRNAKITASLIHWTESIGSGVAFDSSGGFLLPNGANRSPDASWINQFRWDALQPEQKEKFVPLCPDFVIELMSPSDSLPPAQAKMREYIDNGTRLGWLINRSAKTVEVYRTDQAVELLHAPTALHGEPVLDGFKLSLASIW
ncbi:MAG: Uma2 family endonuclease [Cyanobacteria bacterium P01_F01_bin.42]